MKSLFAAQQVINFVKRQGVDELIAKRVEFLTDYQNAAYAEQYRAFVEKVRQAEQPVGGTRLTEAVARYLFKLMAYKDEYEVARLHTDTKFLDKIKGQFEGDFKVVHHLAPPMLAKKNDKGELQKRPFGGWVRPAMGVLAKNDNLPIADTAEQEAPNALAKDVFGAFGTAVEKDALVPYLEGDPSKRRLVYLSVVDTEGVGAQSGLDLQDPKLREQLQEGFQRGQNGTPMISVPVIADSLQEPVIIFGEPVKLAGRVLGVVLGVASLQPIREMTTGSSGASFSLPMCFRMR